MSNVDYIEIVGIKVPVNALKHEVTTLVLAKLRKDGWDGKKNYKWLTPVVREKLLRIKELFRYEANQVVPAVTRLTTYFGISRTVPADLVAATQVSGSISKTNPNVSLRRVMISEKITKERRVVFCQAIADASTMKCWGSKIVHHGNGSYVNLWWDGRVPYN